MSDSIWAPWRLAYVASSKEQPGCFLCEGRDARDDRAHSVVHRSGVSMVVLNRYPYTNGHLLVAPQTHKATLAELSDDELLDGLQVIARMTDVLSRVLRPHGYNVGLNLGKAAGAGLPGHLHWHVVPRWEGDTNFMPVLAGVKVIPQSLDELYDALTAALRDAEVRR